MSSRVTRGPFARGCPEHSGPKSPASVSQPGLSCNSFAPRVVRKWLRKNFCSSRTSKYSVVFFAIENFWKVLKMITENKWNEIISCIAHLQIYYVEVIRAACNHTLLNLRIMQLSYQNEKEVRGYEAIWRPSSIFLFSSLHRADTGATPRMGPFRRVSVNRDDPQARLPPVEAILFLPRAPRMHARTMRARGHEKRRGRKCAARVRLVCWPCVGILSPAGFAPIDRYCKKRPALVGTVLSCFRQLTTCGSPDRSSFATRRLDIF